MCRFAGRSEGDALRGRHAGVTGVREPGPRAGKNQGQIGGSAEKPQRRTVGAPSNDRAGSCVESARRRRVSQARSRHIDGAAARPRAWCGAVSSGQESTDVARLRVPRHSRRDKQQAPAARGQSPPDAGGGMLRTRVNAENDAPARPGRDGAGNIGDARGDPGEPDTGSTARDGPCCRRRRASSASLLPWLTDGWPRRTVASGAVPCRRRKGTPPK